MKKIKQKDIQKHQQRKAEEQNQTAIPDIEEKIDYIKYAAIQLVLGTIALIAMMVVLYMMEMDTKHIGTILVAYFPYFYIQKESPKSYIF